MEDQPIEEVAKKIAAVYAALQLEEYNRQSVIYGIPGKYAFGEISVKLHRPSGHFVMLSNHDYVNEQEEVEKFKYIAGVSPGDEVVDLTVDEFLNLYETRPRKEYLELLALRQNWWLRILATLNDGGSQDDKWLKVNVSSFDDYDVTKVGWDNLRIRARTAPVQAPWDISEDGLETNHSGYGAYIIDEFTEVVDGENEKSLRLWHTLSTWGGGFLPGVYGTFTTYTDVPCTQELFSGVHNCGVN